MSSIPAYAVPGIVEYLAQRKANGDEDATRLLDELPKKGKRKHLASGKSKADRRDEASRRLERLAEIRVALHVEAGGCCAVCGLSLPFARMHAHHVVSGPERQIEERAEMMAPTHEKCHDALHGKNPKHDQRDALVRLLAWCEATGRVQAAESTVRRIGKIDEARASIPGRIEERRPGDFDARRVLGVP